MAQRTSHIYQLVTLPAFYAQFQNALGADRARKIFISDFIGSHAPGISVLDVGCGPATLFEYLGEVEYTGLDINEKHIAEAREIFGNRGRFICGNAVTDLPSADGQFDVVIASGLLHHLNDTEARTLLKRLAELVCPGGYVCTIDPVWVQGQRRVARLLKQLDSGKNIRNGQSYLELAEGLGLIVSSKTYDGLLRVPYDHFAMKLRRV